MQEIGDWLEKLGMPEYGERFTENDIDASVLPHLTDQSLKELGVSLGHRLKILAAIKELSGPTPAAPGPAVAPAEPKPQDTAERRQVTVLFSDLVGSTALSACMDPEDLREIISAYQRCVAETVDRFGGFVAKYMGDGVLVYFGYPQAHEDDAERAVRDSVVEFCNNFTKAVHRWMEANKDTAVVRANIPRLMQYRQGLRPYVDGATVLA